MSNQYPQQPPPGQPPQYGYPQHPPMQQGWPQPGYPQQQPYPPQPYPYQQPPPQVQVVVQQGPGVPRGAVSQGQMGYGEAAFHWLMMLGTCGLWIPVYLSARRKKRTITTFR